MRDALSLLDRLISTGAEPLTTKLLEEFLGCPNSEKINNLIAKIGDSDAAGTLAAVEDLITTGQSEVQIVDSLIDYMRDLMVVKSAGPESKLLILTAEQRQKASELAEKFDVAALVYNITLLERLRWSLKNSDTPRALLDASMLRFALSEHFLNVDELLSQIKGSPVKKKVVKHNPATRVESPSAKPQTIEQPDLPESSDLETPENNQRAVSKPAVADEQTQPDFRANRAKTRGKRRNEIINDPAVKTVLMGLDATITGIEEKAES
jgi:DNA polymerase-3 subunit gamma/tau